MTILVIDGQGGRLGKQIVEAARSQFPDAEILAVGTNATATATMLKAGADDGATGENPVVVACRDADIVIGPLGIVCADSLLGEVTPAMALAVGQCPAPKVLLPINRCNHFVVGVQPMPVAEQIALAVQQTEQLLQEMIK